jgi:hypothetical protein
VKTIQSTRTARLLASGFDAVEIGDDVVALEDGRVGALDRAKPVLPPMSHRAGCRVGDLRCFADIVRVSLAHVADAVTAVRHRQRPKRSTSSLMSSTRQTVVRGPSFTDRGKRPDLTPAHQVDLPTGMGPSGEMIERRRTKPVVGKFRGCDMNRSNTVQLGSERFCVIQMSLRTNSVRRLPNTATVRLIRLSAQAVVLRLP